MIFVIIIVVVIVILNKSCSPVLNPGHVMSIGLHQRFSLIYLYYIYG